MMANLSISFAIFMVSLGWEINFTVSKNSSYLSVRGNQLVLNGNSLFLSGANQAWVVYGQDFGDNNYKHRKPSLERYLRELSDAGGNSIRIWIHVDGTVTPHFDQEGFVIGLDRGGTFLDDIEDYLKTADRYNILVFFCLWNGAVFNPGQFNKLPGLINDTAKLQSYLDNALIPWVNAVKNYTSLGGWDIMNEPEGILIYNIHNSEPCFDTRSLLVTGAGWAGSHYSLLHLQRFINWQADAIHRADPKALVTVGAWSGVSVTDRMCRTDYYKDSCLIQAGGRSQGTLDFYQIHTYDSLGRYNSYSPFSLRAVDYGHSKPIVIGEFNQVRGGGMDISEQFLYAYQKKYSGAWSWHALGTGENSDNWENQKRGIRSLAKLLNITSVMDSFL